MRTSLDRNTLFLVCISALFLVSPVSAEWKIDVLDQPYSFQNVSNTTGTVQMVELTDGSDTPINESQLEGDSYFQYKYNGSTTDMNWLSNGYWYADFNLNNTGGKIEFEAEGETKSSLIGDSTNETNATRTFNVGNMSVDLMTDFSNKINPEDSFDIKVNVTEDINNSFENKANVDLYFTNKTWTSEIYHISNLADEDSDGQDDYYKNFGLEFGLDYNDTYVLHVNTTNSSSVSYNDSFGAQSIVVETLPEIKGEIAYMNASSGCNNESSFNECERGSTIETGFNVTTATAENVNLTLELKNSSSGNWNNHTTTELTKQDGLYTGEVTVPDINTSTYAKKFRVKYNASNGAREEVKYKTIDYRDFKILDKGDSVTGKGSYRVKLEIRKYFTPQLLEDSRIDDSVVMVDEPSGNLLTSFTVSEMERKPDQGYFKKKIDIPLDSETGIYDLSAEVTNLYNETKLETFKFNVTEVQQTFTLNDGEDFDKTVEKTGNHSFNITLENKIDTERNISVEISDSIENFTTVNDGEAIDLNASQSRNVTLRFDVPTVDEYDGEIKFMDEESNYNDTLDVEINHLTCTYRNETVCVSASDINASSDSTGDISKEFTAINFGKTGESYSYTFSLSGNITDYATLSSTATTLNTENDSQSANLTYSVTTPGFYTGTLEISNSEDTVNIPVSLDSNVEATSTSIELPESISLGEVQEGGSLTKEIEVENTGDTEITGLQVSSESYTVSFDSVSIMPGNAENISIGFSEITVESGSLTVTAETASSSTSETVSLTATIIPDYVERADELQQRVISLDSEVSSDSEYQSDLNNVQSTIQDIKTAYRSGDYGRAGRLYDQVSSTLDTVERGVRSSQSGTEDPNTDQGGVPFLPIAAAIFVILVIGFIAYTSIELEQGDPLYNVLG